VSDVTFHVERGQRVALIGRNGAGKTTLLETLLGKRPAPSGRSKIGHNVELAYYSQQSLELPEHLRLVDAVAQGTKLNGPQARTLLGRFLFSGDQVEKPVNVLSGGERRRLALARTVVSGANFLVLDEPTNHLDIESREALEDALAEFPGTILLVSHDRALIEALATRTIAIEDGRLRLRDGAFGEYARDHEPALSKAAPPAAKPAAKEKPQPKAKATVAPATPGAPRRSAREAARIEKQIEGLEEELGAISARLSQPDAYQDHSALAEDGLRHQALQEELAYLYREWEVRSG
jgi:ATP-binding cassette subfamily F protein 3